jgi:hypothetical protein
MIIAPSTRLTPKNDFSTISSTMKHYDIYTFKPNSASHCSCKSSGCSCKRRQTSTTRLSPGYFAHVTAHSSFRFPSKSHHITWASPRHRPPSQRT